MLRCLLGFICFLLVRLGCGHDLKSVSVFTRAERLQAAALVRYPTRYLGSADYYADGTLALLMYYKGPSHRRKTRTVRIYRFFPNGKIKLRSQRHWLGFQLRSTKRWNEAGQLVERYRRNQWASTFYTYVSRRFIYDRNRLVRMELQKAETGCFNGRVLKRKVVAFTPQGRVVSCPSLTATPDDSAANQP